MIITLKQVLPAMERVRLKYVLGDESLLGLAEGDFEKYIFNPVLYIFPHRLNWLKYLALTILLMFHGITVKPKWLYGHLRFKLRRKQGWSQKATNFIFLLPLKARKDQFEITETGRSCSFATTDLLPLDPHLHKEIRFNVPHDLQRFTSQYRDALLSNSYRKHPSTFNGQTYLQAERMLFDVAAVLNAQGSHWWLEGGTLLGLYRDGKLLDWDHDIDLGLRYESKAQLKALIEALKNLEYYVKILDFPDKAGLWKLGDIRLIKLFPRRLYFFHTELCLDLFIFYRENFKATNEPVYKYVVHERNGFHPAAILDELSDLEYKGHQLGRPLQTEAFLASKYGESWGTPVKEWHVAIDDKTILNNMDTPATP